MTSKYVEALAALDVQKEAILAAQAKERGNKKFKCICCDKLHTINKCNAFTFPTWESGSGYDDGRWWEGEIYIQCPERPLMYNRCYFKSPGYGLYNSYDHNADMQFKRMYRDLFKSFTQGSDNTKIGYNQWNNNYYFDDNHKKFDLHVKGIDN